jgi:cysteine desulfurase / selenocysteine lyase
MVMYKQDFPIFANNPWLVFLDNGASCQKPKLVIDGVSDFVSKDYANIHRGMYELSNRSELMYHNSKSAVSSLLSCKENEIFYTYNSTYWINIISGALARSKVLKKWDVVLLWIAEHHANILPWQILSQEYWFELRFFWIKDDYSIDWDDFHTKYTSAVKVVSCTHVSNVTGQIYDVKKIKSYLRDDTFFLVDGSQSVPHFPVDVGDIWCDALVFTWHKMMAYTWIGAVYLKKNWVKDLFPMITGWWTIADVSVFWHTLISWTDKFEAGTPNIIGAISLLKAIEYIKTIWGMEKIWQHEQELSKKILLWFEKLNNKVRLIGGIDVKKRVGAFSFVVIWQSNFNRIGEIFAENNIAVRCGWHCAYPLHKYLDIGWTCRMSTYLYNDDNDIERFFEVFQRIVW